MWNDDRVMRYDNGVLLCSIGRAVRAPRGEMVKYIQLIYCLNGHKVIMNKAVSFYANIMKAVFAQHSSIL